MHNFATFRASRAQAPIPTTHTVIRHKSGAHTWYAADWQSVHTCVVQLTHHVRFSVEKIVIWALWSHPSDGQLGLPNCYSTACRRNYVIGQSRKPPLVGADFLSRLKISPSADSPLSPLLTVLGPDGLLKSKIIVINTLRRQSHVWRFRASMAKYSVLYTWTLCRAQIVTACSRSVLAGAYFLSRLKISPIAESPLTLLPKRQSMQWQSVELAVQWHSKRGQIVWTFTNRKRNQCCDTSTIF